MVNCSSPFAIPARDCLRARPNASLTHSLQPRETGLAWACRSAAQSLSRTAADCGLPVSSGWVQLFSSLYRRLSSQRQHRPAKRSLFGIACLGLFEVALLKFIHVPRSEEHT